MSSIEQIHDRLSRMQRYSQLQIAAFLACVMVITSLGTPVLQGQERKSDASVEPTHLRILNLNILQGGNPAREIGRTSPLYRKPRHQHIAKLILQMKADIVGTTEPRSIDNDPILIELQRHDSKWNRFGKVYSRFPVSADPLNSKNSSRDSIAHRVEIVDGKFVYIHVAHWWPSNGYGPDVVMKHVQAGTVDNDPKKFEEKVLKSMSTPGSYNLTLRRLKPHLDAGHVVFLLGDFNESSHLDWTEEYARRGPDRWVDNPTKMPLRFPIQWRGSKTFTDAGMRDAYRTIFPNPVTHPGYTWTPPYDNGTPGRRPYDGDKGPNQILDRIDWVMFAGKGVSVKSAATVGEKFTNKEHLSEGRRKPVYVPEIQYDGPWPSDHRGVLATFVISDE